MNGLYFLNTLNDWRVNNVECLKCGNEIKIGQRDLSKIKQISLCEKCNQKLYPKEVETKMEEKLIEFYILTKLGKDRTPSEDSKYNALTIEIQHHIAKGEL